MARVRLHPTRSFHGPSGPRSNSKAGIVRFRVDGTLLPREKCQPAHSGYSLQIRQQRTVYNIQTYKLA